LNICLFGISGVYNYGCEAMVRAISNQLKRMYPTSSIVYRTKSFKNDCKVLADCNSVEIQPIHKKTIQKNFYLRGIKYIKKKLGLADSEDYLHIDVDWAKKCDILVVIGGDVFDLIPGQAIKKYYNERIFVSEVVKKNGGTVILWGISVSSFERDQRAKKTLLNYFKNTVDIAVIRDKKSYDYLRLNGVVDNIHLYSDPAYMLRSIQCEIHNDSMKVLGINLSPLSNRYLKMKKTENEWILCWANVICEIYRKLDFNKIMFIPHVVTSLNSKDDDFAYLHKIEQVIKQKGIPVEFVDDNAGFIGVKKYLVKCTLLLSARMHCSVNAITCGVPTVFLSYSSKSIGMCEHVYGNDKMFFDMNELAENTDVVIQKLKQIYEHNIEIREYLRKKNLELYHDAFGAANCIYDYLKEYI